MYISCRMSYPIFNDYNIYSFSYFIYLNIPQSYQYLYIYNIFPCFFLYVSIANQPTVKFKCIYWGNSSLLFSSFPLPLPICIRCDQRQAEIVSLICSARLLSLHNILRGNIEQIAEQINIFSSYCKGEKEEEKERDRGRATTSVRNPACRQAVGELFGSCCFIL